MEQLGVGIFIGVVFSSLTRVYRPIVKGAIKLGLTVTERVKDAFHEGLETFHDLYAEAKHERARAAVAAAEDVEARRGSGAGAGG